MTRKVDPRVKHMRKMNYEFDRLTRMFERTTGTMKDATRNTMMFYYRMTGEQPEYNWPETPERSRMHAMYGRRRNK